MSGVVGLRVVRGPNWQWQSQDGGEGGLGTVVSVTGGSSAARKAVVRWDSGTQASYRMGEGSAYDLRIFDNAACGVKHASIRCDACCEIGIIGIRWKCKICNDYDLCTSCYMTEKHDVTHAFLRITEPSHPAVAVPPRDASSKVNAKGICIGAIVTRSSDWKWDDQDGGQGKTGVVTEISNWPGNSYRNAVRVNWTATQRSDLYRFGHEGKIDVVATTCQQSGKYYPQHLPSLGETEIRQPTPSAVVPNSNSFKIGDQVRTNVPVHALIALQTDHGGWIPEMKDVVGRVGTVRGFTEKGNVQVEFESKKKYIFNPVALSKFKKTSVGGVVKIISDAATAKALQEGHGGWIDSMTQALGKVGKVVAQTPSGNLKVDTGGSVFIWNPECCVEPTNADKEAYATATSAATFATPKGTDDACTNLPKGSTLVSTAERKKFEPGDAVTIMSNIEKVKQLQQGHGGWNEEMTSSVGKTGKVHGMNADGNVVVQVEGRRWIFNPACCSMATNSELTVSEGSDSDSEDVQAAVEMLYRSITTPQSSIQIGIMRVTMKTGTRFKVGDAVKVASDVTRVKSLQTGHGGWNDLMLLALGRTGRVVAIDSDGDLKVSVGGLNWTFNPECLERVAAAEEESASEEDGCLIC